PFNVEFSTKSVTNSPEKEAKPEISETKPSPGTGPVEDRPSDGTTGASATPEGDDQDPKAISASLRRIRASGPLILAAIKQNDRESMERINEIIEQSIQGLNEDKGQVKTPDNPPIKSGVKPGVDSGVAGGAAPPPTQQVKELGANRPIHRLANDK